MVDIVAAGNPVQFVFGCILRASGTLECIYWDEPVADGEYPLPPVSFRMTEICHTPDGSRFCALDAEGLPSCWSYPGEVDMDTTEARALGLPLHGLDCGLVHACALTEAGEAVCWSDDMAGQSSPPGSYVLARGRGEVPR